MTLDDYFDQHGFNPNKEQEQAIKHFDGPLFLVAGPGSGKTRVLLWRTFNLIVFHDVEPRDIFFSTFTEKAARQLKDGLLTLLASVNGRYFDISEMYVGTVHSLCRRILTDKRFNSSAVQASELIDEIDQYFYILDKQFWVKEGKKPLDVLKQLNIAKWNNDISTSHQTTMACVSFFNRLSEECFKLDDIKANKDIGFLANIYEEYIQSLAADKKTDMSLLQQKALDILEKCDEKVFFKHLLIDEYQDTNTVQEQIFFKLSSLSENLCVVGDDDQALYRFRGATVHNLIKFPDRCKDWKKKLTRIDLTNNYRSCKQIVDFYNDFIKKNTYFNECRVKNKPDVIPKKHNDCNHTAVIVSTAADEDTRCKEITTLVIKLLKDKIITDPNQIAFLYPSVKSEDAKCMMRNLEDQKLEVHSPRSGKFLDCKEAKLIFGLMLDILGRPLFKPEESESAAKSFMAWLDECEQEADELYKKGDEKLINLLVSKADELDKLNNSTNWNLLDLFYELCSSETISSWLSLTEQNGDESAILNLSIISQYLFRFQKMHGLSVINDKKNLRKIKRRANTWLSETFFNTYLFGLYEREESEYEDNENSFPKGKIPFLTIHQAKGLEFPVVILGNMTPFSSHNQTIEKLARSIMPENISSSLEDIDKIADYDATRLFYVALSRAENLLILNYDNEAKVDSSLKAVIDSRGLINIEQFDTSTIQKSESKAFKLPKTYSYTADYQYYNSCPRQYMLFRKYGFSPSRTRTMAFGILVHKTIEDIHRRLIDTRDESGMEDFIKDRFNENYLTLSRETAHTLAPETLENACEQAIYYWRTSSDIAKTITKTEVPLTLPGNLTKEKIPYLIYGVVDMVSKDKSYYLYDIKTHAAEIVNSNKAYYQEQLNLYAYIWETLNNETLSGTAIIATKLPVDQSGDWLADWNPIVHLPLDKKAVDDTVKSFGEAVDSIEGREFDPPVVSKLYETPIGAKGQMFNEVCSYCDGRFSCSSYNEYKKLESEDKLIVKAKSKKTKDIFFGKKDEYLESVEDFIEYLVKRVRDHNPLPFHHCYDVEATNKDFKEKQRGKCVEYKKIQDAYTGYSFKNEDYQKNQKALNAVSQKLKSPKDEHALYLACLECLSWGAAGNSFKLYTANKKWLRKKKLSTKLSLLLDQAYTELSAEQPNLAGFKSGLYRMNAGFTKIYALKYDDFIIYDSRVAAALGLLAREYCKEKGLTALPTELCFNIMRNDKRNPRQDKYIFRQLNTKDDDKYHAEWNIKANWILKRVVDHLGSFWGVNGNEQLRALEAALFMIGYSVIPCDESKKSDNSQDCKSTSISKINQQAPTIKGVTTSKTNKNTVNIMAEENNPDNIQPEPPVLPIAIDIRTTNTCGRPERATTFDYEGNVEDGIFIIHDTQRIPVTADFLLQIQNTFAGLTIKGGFSMDNPPEDGLGYWIQTNSGELNGRVLTPRHGSFIAAILRDAGILIVELRGNAVYLTFQDV